mmetsp:Transcript_40070/g.72000  ORF Transcript_40070/g.72000 Transcript_40070/m.72000 type:complete len:214 (-) Transcript_40070:105-746(-)
MGEVTISQVTHNELCVWKSNCLSQGCVARERDSGNVDPPNADAAAGGRCIVDSVTSRSECSFCRRGILTGLSGGPAGRSRCGFIRLEVDEKLFDVGMIFDYVALVGDVEVLKLQPHDVYEVAAAEKQFGQVDFKKSLLAAKQMRGLVVRHVVDVDIIDFKRDREAEHRQQEATTFVPAPMQPQLTLSANDKVDSSNFHFHSADFGAFLLYFCR